MQHLQEGTEKQHLYTGSRQCVSPFQHQQQIQAARLLLQLQTLPMQRSWSAPSKWVQLASVAQHGSILRLLACQHFLRPWQSQDVAGCSSLFGSVPQASAPMQRAAITACCACATPACCGQVGSCQALFKVVRFWSPSLALCLCRPQSSKPRNMTCGLMACLPWSINRPSACGR